MQEEPFYKHRGMTKSPIPYDDDTVLLNCQASKWINSISATRASKWVKPISACGMTKSPIPVDQSFADDDGAAIFACAAHDVNAFQTDLNLQEPESFQITSVQ